tara:strand:+ start:269 stop:622 length:354 start_codon:yes stop_codon:yes gene_type:complete
LIAIDYRKATSIERDIAEKVVEWCIDNIVKHDTDINLELCKYRTYNCWGTCVEGEEDNEFNLTISTDQCVRDFVATITHEMIHVKQYVTGKWRGDGEAECERLQYKLADKIWKEGLV